MNIDEQLAYLETTIKEDIDKMSAKDRGNYYQTLHEFTRAKMQRTQTVAGDKLPSEIKLTLVK